MRFRPRHYLLIVIVLALGAFNIYRAHRARSMPVVAPNHEPAHETAPTPPQAAAAWAAFDKAAGLRDAPADQFLPAAQDLQHQIDIAQPASVMIDVKGCQTWLQFYRQSHESAWHDRSLQHLNTCMSQHADIG